MVTAIKDRVGAIFFKGQVTVQSLCRWMLPVHLAPVHTGHRAQWFTAVISL